MPRYLLFNKPFNVLCQFTSPSTTDRTSPARLLSNYVDVKDVYPAGRLDHDSEGLVVLTNDGRFQHELTDPKFEHLRTYWIQVEGTISAQALKRLSRGVHLRDCLTRPAEARLIAPNIPDRNPPIRYRASIPTSWLELSLTEGRNRQARRMTAAVGFPTLRLIRVAIGPIWWEGLGVGSWRDLTRAEVKALGTRRPKSKPSGI